MATQINHGLKSNLIGNLGGASPTGYFVESKLFEILQNSAKQLYPSSRPIHESYNSVSYVPTSNFSGSYNEFHAAACLGSEFTLSDLLTMANANEINQQDAHGNTPLHWAASENHSGIVKLLLENGAEPNLQNFAGETPLFIAASRGSSDSCLFLLKCSANPNLTNLEGATPLHMAVANGHAQVAKVLLQFGAFVYIQDEEGDSVLHYAVRESQYEIVAALLSSYLPLAQLQNEDEETAYNLSTAVQDLKMIQIFQSFI